MADTPSTKYGMARPADGDNIKTYPVTARSMIDWVDANISTFITTLPRPAAQFSGRWHLDTGTGVVSFDTGSSWVEIARAAMIAEVPLGTVVPYAALTLPTDGRWSWADGGLLSTSTYAAYYAIVGHAYNGGVDPGGGNFRKPDKRGRVMVGADNMGQGAAGRLPNSPRAVGQNGGVERHPLALGELAVHLHADGTLGAVAVGDHTHGPEAGFPWATVWPGDVADGDHPGSGIAVSLHQSATTAGAGGHGHDVSGSTANSGSGTAHQNLQPYEIDNVIVRVK